MFVDRAKIYIRSGKGGDGAVTFRREPFVPEGGPDGGDGGRGGDVIFQADRNLRTSMDFKYKKKYEAENGQNGMKKKRFGKAGENLIIKVPMGTVVIDEETGLVILSKMVSALSLPRAGAADVETHISKMLSDKRPILQKPAVRPKSAM